MAETLRECRHLEWDGNESGCQAELAVFVIILKKVLTPT